MKNLLFLISLILSLNNFNIIGADLAQNVVPQNQGKFECPGCKQLYSTLDDMKDCTQTLECYGHGLVEYPSETSKQKKPGDVKTKNEKKGRPKTDRLGKKKILKTLTALNIIKKHACTICDKKFNKKSDLKRHFRTHTGEKPYKCKHCDIAFAGKDNRKRHENIHTLTKLYTCPIEGCTKQFARSDNVTQHLKHSHKS